MSEQKQYVGSGKEIGKFGQINISLKYSDLTPNEKGYINLCVGKRREVDQYGKTHTVWVDTWKPDPNYNKQGSVQQTTQPNDPVDNDLPF